MNSLAASAIEKKADFVQKSVNQQSSHGCSQTCNRYEICGRLHSSSEELKRQAEFLSVILQVCPRWRSVSAPKRLFLAPKRSRRFFMFLQQNFFFSHQLGFFPAPKQFFSAPNDFGNCIWFCTKLILFLHQNDTKSLEAGTKLFWFCTKYFLDFFWFSTKYIPILHQFVTN